MLRKIHIYKKWFFITIGRTVEYWRENGIRELLFAIYQKVYRNILRRYPKLYEIRHYILRLLFPSRFTDANPMKIVWVDPNQIAYIVEKKSCPSSLGRVRGGTWDQNCEKFENTKLYQSIKARLDKNADWENTLLYRNLLNPTEDVIWNRRYNSVEELNERMATIDALAESLKKDGYITQKELLMRNPDQTKAMNNDAIHPLFNEIRVVIGRNGDFHIRRRGLHRLAIAKIIELDKVGVQVAVRHSEWQKIRDEIRRIGPETVDMDLRSHPDLEDVVVN